MWSPQSVSHNTSISSFRRYSRHYGWWMPTQETAFLRCFHECCGVAPPQQCLQAMKYNPLSVDLFGEIFLFRLRWWMRQNVGTQSCGKTLVNSCHGRRCRNHRLFMLCVCMCVCVRLYSHLVKLIFLLLLLLLLFYDDKGTGQRTEMLRTLHSLLAVVHFEIRHVCQCVCVCGPQRHKAE